MFISFRYAPIGIFFNIAVNISDMEDLAEIGARIGKFLVVYLFTITFHLVVTNSILYYVITRKNPFLVLKGSIKALLTAFGTSSR